MNERRDSAYVRVGDQLQARRHVRGSCDLAPAAEHLVRDVIAGGKLLLRKVVRLNLADSLRLGDGVAKLVDAVQEQLDHQSARRAGSIADDHAVIRIVEELVWVVQRDNAEEHIVRSTRGRVGR